MRLANRMFRAISFGVFCREAPSTRAIIRSTKLSPALAVISHDDAVRQHLGASGDRAPVAARLTDHRSGLARDRGLVDAGDAFDDVTVTGDDLAGLDDDPVTQPELRGRDGSSAPSRSDACATVSVLARRKDAAWALPRPSATASETLANSTVSQSHTTIDQPKNVGIGDRQRGRQHRADLDDEHDG